MISPKVPIAKEGYPFIGSASFVTMICAILGHDRLTAIFFIATFFILYFFRDPERFTPKESHALISPADGKIILIEKIFDDRFFHEYVHKVSIFMNIFNVHVNRIPVDGTVDQITYTPGMFYSADTDRGGLRNENCAAVITCESGRKIAVVQVAGLIARRIVCWLEPGDRVQQGERFGIIRFGSRVDLYIPGSVDFSVERGQNVKAGETVLGRLLS
jgi:phosphatidylserine decarboxylase